MKTTISHWLPIFTFCPVNSLPDLIYVEVTFEYEFVELYAVRKRLKKALQFKKMFMEDIASEVRRMFPTSTKVVVRLPFNKHVVTIG